MTKTSHQVQRLLAAEFESRGWTYDVSGCREVAESLVTDPTSEARLLARKLNLHVLAMKVPSRSDVADAIDAVKSSIARRPSQTGTPMRLLFVAAGPDDEQRLRLAAEHREIRAAVRSSTHRDDIVLEENLAARPGDLIDELNRFTPSILHFSGHGSPSGIALEDAEGLTSGITTAQLAQLVTLADRALRLVVLNSCDSAVQAKPVSSKVDAAIGMTREIGDDAARTFAVQLYASLGEGVPLRRAFDQARLQISLAGLAEEQTPQLYVKSGVDAAEIRFTSG